MDYDDAYANAPHIPDAKDYPARWAAASGAWAERLGAQDRRRAALSYGPTARNRFDLFLPEEDAKGLLVFVHGGYWLKFDRADWFHLSQGALAHGWAVAMPSYDLCPQVRIAQITRQIATAITAAARLVQGSLVLAGHSAGGQLVARMLEPGLLAPEIAARLHRIMPISPVADLRPLLHTAMNADLRLDADEAAAESPALMVERLGIPATVWVGGDERPAFLDQARWLADAWNTELSIAPGRHHFDIIDGLIDPESAMIGALLC